MLRPLSPTSVVHALETFRTLLRWSKLLEVALLPADFVVPVTDDLVGIPAEADPLRKNPFPADVRARLIRGADRWQLCHLALSLVLPLRPEEACGLLVTEVDFERTSSASARGSAAATLPRVGCHSTFLCRPNSFLS